MEKKDSVFLTAGPFVKTILGAIFKVKTLIDGKRIVGLQRNAYVRVSGHQRLPKFQTEKKEAGTRILLHAVKQAFAFAKNMFISRTRASAGFCRKNAVFVCSCQKKLLSIIYIWKRRISANL